MLLQLYAPLTTWIISGADLERGLNPVVDEARGLENMLSRNYYILGF